MFKKGIVTLLMTILLSVPVLAADRPCDNIWNKVQTKTYELVVNEQVLDVVFSPAYAGPCPQGEAVIYLDEENIGTCWYTSRNNMVILNFDGTELTFVLADNELIMIDPNTLRLTKK